MLNRTNLISKSKPHFHILDGLRGVAAIIILIFHYLELVYLDDYETNILGHGYLAVDFFFCLSGFVVAYAYNHRMKEIGVKNFFINRLIRLHPLVVVGSIIGLIAYLIDPFVTDVWSVGWDKMSISFLGSIFLIPTPILPYRMDALFPFNSPAWSLFFEYIISIVYGVVLWRMNKKWLVASLSVAGAFMIYQAHADGWINSGWDFPTFTGGFIRVTYSFIAGLVVYKFNLIWKNKLGLFLPLLLLLGCFFYPHVNNDWITESIIVMIIFPLILSIGAGAQTNSTLESGCKFLGDLSYPLYMTHISGAFIFLNYIKSKTVSIDDQLFISSISIMISLVFGYLMMKYVDTPIRHYLNKKRKEYLMSKEEKEPLVHS
ncbi:acyltransferase family protein [Flammeovirga yaeyamensis]|uniref:Acyltransferase family protein n=1 Tax=Flammeovirga yaeyamensis TaxID=367791 RepID=A0AAX1N7G8_9BACT|nr:acyltransferase [Flammeovirga yaeyamensis]MBB3698007.1 peptidoglycan/LPS O-acetylase OafA/YrhL [Flammeovirga yaeyamensis]NMF35641.1 acyltransferase [Flammeovirga yaeyamensis]QWG03402.1 acyltransferase family protein [Flammeovirga yaeyamensis]